VPGPVAEIRRAHWGLLALAIAGVSVSSVLVRYAQAESVPSLVISFYRMLFATLMLAPFALARMRRGGWGVGRRDVGLLAVVGFLLAAHFATWVTSLEYTSVASSAVLVTTEALWVPLGAAFLLRERVGARVWTGVLIAFGGSILLVAGDLRETRFGGLALLGDFLAFAGALAASMYFLAGRRLRQRFDLVVYATVVYAFSAMFLLAMVLVRGDPLWPYSDRAFFILFLFAFFPMIVGHTTINYLLRWVPPHYISTAILAEPVVSALLAWMLLDEAVLPLVFLGGAVILLGILVATSRAGADAPSAAPAAP
jgi:drug/metabolite transporter (DMT)-like permease